MDQSPAWKVPNASASKEIPRILWKPIFVAVTKQPATGPCAEPHECSPCLAITFMFKNDFHVNLPSTPRYLKWTLSFRFLHQIPACIFLLPQACSATCTAHLVVLDLKSCPSCLAMTVRYEVFYYVTSWNAYRKEIHIVKSLYWVRTEIFVQNNFTNISDSETVIRKSLKEKEKVCDTVGRFNLLARVQRAARVTVSRCPHCRLKWENLFKTLPWQSRDRTRKQYLKCKSCFFLWNNILYH